ncbi:MAG: hypothetical protein APF76_14595 [Desulfitibacter sp. BRH_c19]|nr:MAG: hypothetical protein APF76_14595 [Desulfitibacter sp. BRH_c19]
MDSLYKDNLTPTCIICKTKPFNGLDGGLLIRSKLICSACEKRIIQTPVDDQYYFNFKEQLKALWYCG